MAAAVITAVQAATVEVSWWRGRLRTGRLPRHSGRYADSSVGNYGAGGNAGRSGGWPNGGHGGDWSNDGGGGGGSSHVRGYTVTTRASVESSLVLVEAVEAGLMAAAMAAAVVVAARTTGTSARWCGAAVREVSQWQRRWRSRRRL